MSIQATLKKDAMFYSKSQNMLYYALSISSGCAIGISSQILAMLLIFLVSSHPMLRGVNRQPILASLLWGSLSTAFTFYCWTKTIETAKDDQLSCNDLTTEEQLPKKKGSSSFLLPRMEWLHSCSACVGILFEWLCILCSDVRSTDQFGVSWIVVFPPYLLVTLSALSAVFYFLFLLAPTGAFRRKDLSQCLVTEQHEIV